LLAEGSHAALHDAQLALARSYGFPSWPKLKAFVDGVTVSRLTGAVRAGDVAEARKMLERRPELVHMDMAGDDEHRGRAMKADGDDGPEPQAEKRSSPRHHGREEPSHDDEQMGQPAGHGAPLPAPAPLPFARDAGAKAQERPPRLEKRETRGTPSFLGFTYLLFFG